MTEQLSEWCEKISLYSASLRRSDHWPSPSIVTEFALRWGLGRFDGKFAIGTNIDRGKTVHPKQSFQPSSVGDCLLTPACPVENVTLWVGFLYLTNIM